MSIIALALVDVAVRGAFGIPRNDDWVYYRSAILFAETGRFQPEFASALLFGQVLLAWPLVKVFGPVLWPLQLLGSAFGALGLWGTYLLLRQLLPRWAATAATSVLAFGPLYLSSSTTFMSDPFSYALQVWAMLAAVWTWKQTGARRWWGVAATLLIALAGFSIREYALAGGAAAILLVLWGQWRTGGWKRVLATVGVCFVWGLAIIALFYWRRSIPGAHSTSGTINPPLWTIRSAWGALMTLTLFVAPIVAFLSPVRVWVDRARARWVWWLLPAAVVLAIVLWLRSEGGAAMFVSNYVFVVADYVRPLIGSVPYAGTIAGPDPVLFPFEVSSVLSIVAVCVFTVLVTVYLLRERVAANDRTDWLGVNPARLVCILFLVISALGYAAVMIGASGQFFDRYAMPVTAILAGLFLDALLRFGWVTRISRIVGTIALVLFSLVGLFYVDLAASFDGAKWRLGSAVAARGYEPATIEGGYEWFGWHQPDEWYDRLDENVTHREPYWEYLFTERPICAAVRYAGDESMGWRHRVIEATPIPSLVGDVGGLEAWVPLRATPGCPAPPR